MCCKTAADDGISASAEMQQGGKRWQARRVVESFAAHDVVVLMLLLRIQAQQHVQLDADDLGPRDAA